MLEVSILPLILRFFN